MDVVNAVVERTLSEKLMYADEAYRLIGWIADLVVNASYNLFFLALERVSPLEARPRATVKLLKYSIVVRIHVPSTCKLCFFGMLCFPLRKTLLPMYI